MTRRGESNYTAAAPEVWTTSSGSPNEDREVGHKCESRRRGSCSGVDSKRTERGSRGWNSLTVGGNSGNGGRFGQSWMSPTGTSGWYVGPSDYGVNWYGFNSDDRSSGGELIDRKSGYSADGRLGRVSGSSLVLVVGGTFRIGA